MLLKTIQTLFVPLFLLVAHHSYAQDVIPLYDGVIPNSILDTTSKEPAYVPDTYMPSITLMRPPEGKANGKAVVICSGGAYLGVADPVEGIPAAMKLTQAGITCFLVQYRVPESAIMKHKDIVPSQDVQRAIQYVREHAEMYHLDTNKIGIMGFSAGGHLVSTVCTHLSDVYIDNPKGTNLRPDFEVLIYPVISFADSITHAGSRSRLIGPDITPDQVARFSNELHVTAATPPTFITHAIDDKEVNVANTLYFVAALEQQKVPVQVFLYAHGGHAFGAFNKTSNLQWIDACIDWINTEKYKAPLAMNGH